MREVPHYQCEHCNTVYADPERAKACEEGHILYYNIEIIQATHSKRVNDFGRQFPKSLIVAQKGCEGLVWYEYKGEADPLMDLLGPSREYGPPRPIDLNNCTSGIVKNHFSGEILKAGEE